MQELNEGMLIAFFSVVVEIFLFSSIFSSYLGYKILLHCLMVCNCSLFFALSRPPPAPLHLFLQAILSGNFWHKEYGLLQRCTHRPAVKVAALLQQLALPLLEKLNTLLEDKQPAGLSSSTCRQSVSAAQSAPDRGTTIVIMSNQQPAVSKSSRILTERQEKYTLVATEGCQTDLYLEEICITS